MIEKREKVRQCEVIFRAVRVMLTLLMQIDAFKVMKKGKSDASEFGNL
jgi:hypothetical protein